MLPQEVIQPHIRTFFHNPGQKIVGRIRVAGRIRAALGFHCGFQNVGQIVLTKFPAVANINV